jgi:hypothetical protein
VFVFPMSMQSNIRRDLRIKDLNVELARGEQAFICLRQIECPTPNTE